MFKLRWVRPAPRAGATHPPQPYSPNTLQKAPRIQGATQTVSVCPYCAVGCSTLVHTRAGKLINVEGNPQSPINEGTLCPKGANIFQLAVNTHRVTRVMYRAPYSDHWEYRTLDWALDRIAARFKEARDRGFSAKSDNGKTMNAVRNIGVLGGAVLDNEENYLMKKLFGGGLGLLSIENQARI